MLIARGSIRLFGAALSRWRCTVVALALAAALGASPHALAQNVMIVMSGDAKPYKAAQSAMSERLESLGIHSRTVTLSSLTTDLSGATLRDQNVDVIVAVGTPATLRLYRQLDPKIRLISCMVTGNIAGKVDGRRGMIVLDMQLSVAKQFELLGEALPDAHRIGMMYSSTNPASKDMFEGAQAVAPRGSEIIGIDVDAHSSKSGAIKALLRARPEVIWTDADTAVYDGAVVRALLLGALKKNIPVFGFSLEFVRAGALIGVGVDPGAQGRLAADTVKSALDQEPVFEGMSSSAVLVLEAHGSEVAVNLLVADQIGIDVPRALIDRSTHIFK